MDMNPNDVEQRKTFRARGGGTKGVARAAEPPSGGFRVLISGEEFNRKAYVKDCPGYQHPPRTSTTVSRVAVNVATLL